MNKALIVAPSWIGDTIMAQPLFVTQGQFLRGPVEEGRELESRHHLGNALPFQRALQTLDAGVKRQVLPHGEQPIEGEFLSHVAQAPLGLAAGMPQVEPRHPGIT